MLMLMTQQRNSDKAAEKEDCWSSVLPWRGRKGWVPAPKRGAAFSHRTDASPRETAEMPSTEALG